MSPKNLQQIRVLPQAAADYVLRNLSFFGFLASLILVYIYIVHQGMSRVRAYQQLEGEVTELSWEYQQAQSELKVLSQQSRIAPAVPHLRNSETGSLPVKVTTP